MNRWLALFSKDLKLLLRDRAGLAVLFLMPLALVIVISIVHDAALKSLEFKALRVAVAIDPADPLSGPIKKALTEAPALDVEEGAVDMEAAIRSGRFKAGIIFPKNFSEGMKSYLAGAQPAPVIQVLYDPALPASFRQLVSLSVEKTMTAIEANVLKAALMGEQLESNDERLAEPSGVAVITRPDSEKQVYPTSTQQNVPAWTLFALFFIALPLSGALLAERHSGILTRLMVSPAAFGEYLGAKVAVYCLVGLIQFAFMLWVGIWILPLLGLPALQLGTGFFRLFLIALSSSLAAVGYGVAVGTIAGSHQQASMFGATSIVIAAALGGVMVPVFAMPPGLRLLSDFSPLTWGLNAYVDVFLRDSSLLEILPNVGRLLCFSLVSTAVAIGCHKYKRLLQHDA
ncbi:MAG: hypothetical protein A2X46_17815 [Lentisphaerae bacterium GWF2_57_35]|nr:MAG: hypothetical protein A2X46_17815 [Lentisphaerae bacterium GWF2_57_35]